MPCSLHTFDRVLHSTFTSTSADPYKGQFPFQPYEVSFTNTLSFSGPFFHKAMLSPFKPEVTVKYAIIANSPATFEYHPSCGHHFCRSRIPPALS
jgi:hypothetical protein